ncbi:MAG: hypothetical protein IKO80_09770 [Lachnospiraceae bacterium]|nr:hypothetical protein [Lachnospiraceae bacterium]
MSRRRSYGFIYLIIAIVTILVVGGIAFLFYRKLTVKKTMIANEEGLTVNYAKNDGLILSWNEAENAGGYRMEVYDPDNDSAPIVEKSSRKAKCLLDPEDLAKIPMDKQVDIRITTGTGRKKDEESIVTDYLCCLSMPRIEDLEGIIDIDTQSIEVRWKGWDCDIYTIYLRDPDDNRKKVREIEAETDGTTLTDKEYLITIPYGHWGDFEIPKDDREYVVEMEAHRGGFRVMLPGDLQPVGSITRVNLITKKITLQYERLDNNIYRINWNDTGSPGYCVEMKESKKKGYKELTRIGGDEKLVYEIAEHLNSGTEYTFRVRGLSEEEIAAASGEGGEAKTGSKPTRGAKKEEVDDKNAGILTVKTEEGTQYANIWPMKALEIYSDTSKKDKIGTVEAQKCLCVLDQDKEAHLFRVRSGDIEGYINSDYCMINLPDYLGDYCEYDIPNSYASIYMVNDYYIPGVTAQIIPGYENVLLNDNTFLVPLLYPVAEKLTVAAKSVREEGMKILINDSFRPHCATRYIYDTTSKIVNIKLPYVKYWAYRTPFDIYLQNDRKVIENVSSVYPDGYEGPAHDAPKGVSTSSEEDLDKLELDQIWAEQETLQGLDMEDMELVNDNTPRNTYQWEMTNGTYKLGAFLAAVASRHNLGVAMDMTIVSEDDVSEPLEMQTNMHNLSWNSAQKFNNDNANTLKRHLEAAGFAMISSEWWHFQDNELTTKLAPPVLENGISVEGWKYDGRGWKYRDEKGDYTVSGTLEIDGREYAFDADGYTER